MGRCPGPRLRCMPTSCTSMPIISARSEWMPTMTARYWTAAARVCRAGGPARLSGEPHLPRQLWRGLDAEQAAAPLCLARPHPRKGPVAHGGQDLWRFCGAGCVWLWPGAGWGNDGWRIGWNVYGGASRAEAAGARRARADERGRRAPRPAAPARDGALPVAGAQGGGGYRLRPRAALLCAAPARRGGALRRVGRQRPVAAEGAGAGAAVGLVERISFRCGDGLSVLEAARRRPWHCWAWAGR